VNPTLLQREYVARGNRCDACVCRLNGVFLFFVAALSVQPGLATYGSLVFTFSPPVSGFSFLVRNFNAQSYSNNSRITVTTASGSVIHSVLTQANGDINFIGWFQNDSSIASVALSPLTFRFFGSLLYVMAMTVDELRVYTRNVLAPSIAFSLDNCNTPTPFYPNGTTLSAVFSAATVEAGLVASLQNFDSATASSTAPNSISFPTGSAFNGSVDISVVNGTLISQTCTFFLVLQLSTRARQTRTQTQAVEFRWQRACAARGNRYCVCVCRLTNVFLFFVAAAQTFTSASFAYGSLVFTFSPPVSGFSFLVRNFNAQEYSNASKITVTTAAGIVIHSALAQTDGDINFIGWFQNGSSITSVALSPLAFRFHSTRQFNLNMALDELRVYTRNAPAPSISFSLDHCDTQNPVYPNGTALSAVFIASTIEAGLVASLQDFDSQPASSNAPNSISFPTGSAFNGTVGISVVDGTLISQTCTLFLVLELPVRLRQTKTRPRFCQTITSNCLQRAYAARCNRCDMCVCRLNGVFLFFVSTLASQSTTTFGSLVLTFSPPVSGFSFLVRNFNFQSYSNNSKITVMTASDNVTHSVPFQDNGDINFVGYFQNDSSITSVTLSPLSFQFSGVELYATAMALDELRVYTRNAPAPSIAFSLDNCETPNPVYPNGTALSAVFIASTVEAGLVASLQDFDSNIASSPVPNSIVFPTGSAFTGTVEITVVNASLSDRTCKPVAIAAAANCRR
jgi:hypothetical protein